MVEVEMRSRSSEKYEIVEDNANPPKEKGQNKILNKFSEINNIVKSKSRLGICAWISVLLFSAIGLLLTICLLRVYVVMAPPDYDRCLNSGLYQKRASPLDDAIVDRLRQVIRTQTIAYDIGIVNNASFIKLHRTLKTLFPGVHSSSRITRTVINKFSLLYKIQGANKDLKPYLLNTHLDVVPVEGQDWTVPPFEALLKDGYIYGRGTLDMKQILMAILESVETLLKNGYKFQRTFYIGCGHDEEVYGHEGAGEIAKYLKRQGVHEFEYIIDEGLPILDGLIKGISRPTLIIGIAEKGIATLNLSVSGDTGHSSFPKYPSSIGVLSKAIVNLESERQPIHFEGIARDTFEALAPYMSFFKRFFLSNLWLFKAAVKINLSKDEANNALIRTTTAVTIFHSGIKDNVIPGKATAIINHRLHPLQSFENVLATDKSIIADARVKITTKMNLPASAIASTDTHAYNIIEKAITNIFEDIIVVPGLCIARTDSSHYTSFTKNVYRLNPVVLNKEDVKGIHGKDERISIEGYRKEIEFYTLIIKLGDESSLECKTNN